jgi:hypothetical protein
MLKKISVLFAGGCFGGICNIFTGWVFEALHISSEMGMKMPVTFEAPAVYRPIIWGGIWGFIFILPLFNKRPVLKGIFLSIAPSLVALFVFMPIRYKAILEIPGSTTAMTGMNIGILMTIYVLMVNAVWGIAAGLWVYAAVRKD